MTRTTVLASVVLLALGCSGEELPTQQSTRKLFDFESPDNVVGKLPPGWTPAETDGGGTPAAWSVDTDASAPAGRNVLAVHTANIEQTFNLIVYDGLSGADIEAELAIRPRSGTDDQGGGIIFRVQDAMNYYLARWNPLEKNVRFYVVEGARRTTLGSADVEPTSGWHKLGIRARGPAHEVTFDGRSVIQVNNDRIAQKGRVGLWTKADASSAFDAFGVVVAR